MSDELDSVILQELQQNARRTDRGLAKRLGVAPSTIFVLAGGDDFLESFTRTDGT